jgi:hypothetical protein
MRRKLIDEAETQVEERLRAPAKELMHSLGAVQPTARTSSSRKRARESEPSNDAAPCLCSRRRRCLQLRRRSSEQSSF